MMNAYRLGQLTAQPQRFEKMASNSQLKRAVMQKFAAETKEAIWPFGGGAADAGGGGGGGAADAGAGDPGIMDKIKGMASSAGKGIASGSEWAGGKLGGTPGGSGLANPHTRTIVALLSLLGAGYGGYKMMGGGSGEQKER